MPLFSRRHLLGVGTAALLAPAMPLGAATNIISTASNGTALDGYDTTAYWLIGAALKSTGDYSVDWHGARWMFDSQDAADLFAENPDAFAPQFGGHCTRAMSFGKVVNGDPEVWRMYQGKLYLFAKPVGGEKFDEGQDAMIAQAQTHWDGLG